MKIELKIEGMHCPSCSMLIADALEDIGVSNSDINAETGNAVIEFDESKVSVEKIKKTIVDEGYKIK
ncbi:copper-binding protein [Candidatus Woesearchaeota archaeon]|jgi:copper chaperone CopZ|nr:copper-binding protein [Candidatus Woesearchaeota archaeon]MBT4208164.1 copper-binding protein [Candidatus Woesearchaeota archaeon]MBT4730641.1 copper-binding protein [Candidatus Woesearchaeota archaeon]MBT4783192.1 copper-binding protein [Candidatus Woesearchaeota archaeon]MBT5043283.1 copper-binding protein [Candidatus Woesearchaeota archaeon]